MIYIQTLDKNWSPGKFLISTESKAFQVGFELYIANLYVQEVKKAIDTQKYKGRWKPLSLPYILYKKRKGQSLHTWEATSQLKNSLKVYGNHHKIVVGWDKRLVHKNSRKPLWVIAREMELGSLTKPPRPLFRYVYKTMSKNIRFYLNKFKSIFNTQNVTIKSIVAQVINYFR